MAAEKAMVHKRRFLKIYSLKFCDIWQKVYFYGILNNENFKMKVEQTKLMSHLIMAVHYIIDYQKARLLKFGQISF